jgi:hypothetical protein
MQTKIDSQWSNFLNGCKAIAEVENDQEFAQDGIAGGAVNRHKGERIIETVEDVILRNLFPRATPEQRAAVSIVISLRIANQSVPRDGILSADQMEIQHAYEAKKALVRHFFPLDEVTPLQRHYLEFLGC